ncbi:hypothetical protein ACFX2I_040713 [Malus domestica]
MRFLTYDCRTEEKEALLGLDSRDENDLKDIRENYVQLRMNWYMTLTQKVENAHMIVLLRPLSFCKLFMFLILSREEWHEE